MTNSESDLRRLNELVSELKEHGHAWALLNSTTWLKQMQTKTGKAVCGVLLENLGDMAARINRLEHENSRFEQTVFGLRDDLHALTDVILEGHEGKGLV